MIDQELPLRLAEEGFYTTLLTFSPLPENKPQPLMKWGSKATLDLNKIKKWRFKEAQGIAIITDLSCVAVLDIDTHTVERNGLESLKQFEVEHGPLPETYTEESSGGGLHYIFQLPEGVELNFAKEILPGIEVKSGRCLATIAPSVRNGKQYKATEPLSRANLAKLPASIVEAVNKVKEAEGAAKKAKAQAARKQTRKSGKKPRRAGGMDPKAKDLAWARAALEGVCTDVLEVGEGGRNTTLNNAALRMFRIVNGGAIPEEEVFEGLRDTGLAAGLQESEILQTIESAKKAAQALPPIYRPDDWQPALEPQIVERDGHQVRLPLGFFYRASDGALMHAEYDKEGNPTVPTYVCPHIEVVARAESADDWGTVFEFKDRRHKTRRVCVSSRLFQSSRPEFAEQLASAGLDILPGQQKLFKLFALGFGDDLPIIDVVERTGWHKREGWTGQNYVLSDETIGPDASRIMFQANDAGISGLYLCRGTLEQWQKIPELCRGSTRFVFALCTPFASTLMHFSQERTAIFNLQGASSGGKTTALILAASAFGDPDPSAGRQLRTWQATGNGLEAIASCFSDNLLVLDELSQVTPRVLNNAVYLLANGTGKTRANQRGNARQVKSWRTLVFSSGELGYSEKLSEDGIQTRAGQGVRFIGIPTDKEDVCPLDGMSSQELVEKVRSIALKNHGVAGREFLRRLSAKLETLRDQVTGLMDTVTKRLCPADFDPQVQRVARSFALVEVGGTLAQDMGILPNSLDVSSAVQACFAAWLAERGTAGALEDLQILNAVRLFIERHGSSRFVNLDNPEARACVNRAGFCRYPVSGEPAEWFCLPMAFKNDVLKGLDVQRAVNVLKKVGWLQEGDQPGRDTVRVRVPAEGQRRLYRLIIADD